MSIGDKIRQRRKAIGMSQAELASKLGYTSRSSINKIEKDINDIPQLKIIAFAEALETTPAFLMDWKDTPVKQARENKYFSIKKSDLVEQEKSNKIANRLENAIKNSNLSYAELEKRTNISKSALQRYASGKTKKIPLDVITCLAPILGVTPQYLMGLEDYNTLIIEKVKTILESNNETRKNLIDAIMKLPDEDIALLDTIVNRLNKKTD